MLTARYQPNRRSVINAGYRLVRDINPAKTIEQADLSFAWPLGPDWRTVGRWSFALNEDSDQTLEAFGGLEYESCCWGFRTVVRRFPQRRRNRRNRQLLHRTLPPARAQGLDERGEQDRGFAYTRHSRLRERILMSLLSSVRRRWQVRLVACAIGGACASGLPVQGALGTDLDRIVAVVNDDIIASSELEAHLNRAREQLRQSGTAPPPPDALRRRVLERLILIRLQLQLAARFRHSHRRPEAQPDVAPPRGAERTHVARVPGRPRTRWLRFREVSRRDPGRNHDLGGAQAPGRKPDQYLAARYRRQSRDDGEPRHRGGAASISHRTHPDCSSRRCVVRGDRRGPCTRRGRARRDSGRERTSRTWR